jgi:hypothetical protein
MEDVGLRPTGTKTISNKNILAILSAILAIQSRFWG